MSGSVSEDIRHIRQLWPSLEEITHLDDGGYGNCYRANGVVLKRYTKKGLKRLEELFLRKDYTPKRENIYPCLDQLIERIPQELQKSKHVSAIRPRYCKDDIIGCEYINGISLDYLIYLEKKKRIKIPLTEKITIGIQLCSTIAQLQQHQTIHGDVTPSNIIIRGLRYDKAFGQIINITSTGKPSMKKTKPRITLIDLDHTHILGSENAIKPNVATICTIEYAPAEYLSEGVYKERSETDPLGKIIYELFTHKTLFGRQTLKNMILYGDRLQEISEILPGFKLETDEDIEAEIKHTITQALRPHHRRPLASEIRERLELVQEYAQKYALTPAQHQRS